MIDLIQSGWLGIVATLAILAATSALLAGVGALFRLTWHAMRAMVRVGDAVPTLLMIAEQFQPNGGNSLHDQITAIREEQLHVASELIKAGSMAERLSALEAASERDCLRLDALTRAITAANLI